MIRSLYDRQDALSSVSNVLLIWQVLDNSISYIVRKKERKKIYAKYIN